MAQRVFWLGMHKVLVKTELVRLLPPISAPSSIKDRISGKPISLSDLMVGHDKFLSEQKTSSKGDYFKFYLQKNEKAVPEISEFSHLGEFFKMLS